MFQPHAEMSPAFLHVAGLVLQGACVGFAGLWFPLSFRGFPGAEVKESESLMNFASLGALPCICEGRHTRDLTAEPAAERRHSCRSCGNATVPFPAHMLDHPITREEAQKLIRLLREAGIRARNLEIPRTIQNVHELMAYLDGQEQRRDRKPPRRPNAPVSANAGERVAAS